MNNSAHQIHTVGQGRQFQSDFLERFSKSHGLVPLFFYTPIALYFLVKSMALLSGLQMGVGFIVGMFFWTLFEYGMHRSVFHWTGSAKIHFFIHGIHHDYPNDRWRLVMPVGASLALAVPVWLLTHAFLPSGWAEIFFSGFVIGYVWYDTTHYWTHISRPTWKWAVALKRHHMKHHFVSPETRFGVSTPLWDWVFGTSK